MSESIVMPVGSPQIGFATKLFVAADSLQQPARELFQRLYLSGESEEVVCQHMNLSAERFRDVRSSALRAVMAASS